MLCRGLGVGGLVASWWAFEKWLDSEGCELINGLIPWWIHVRIRTIGRWQKAGGVSLKEVCHWECLAKIYLVPAPLLLSLCFQTTIMWAAPLHHVLSAMMDWNHEPNEYFLPKAAFLRYFVTAQKSWYTTQLYINWRINKSGISIKWNINCNKNKCNIDKWFIMDELVNVVLCERSQSWRTIHCTLPFIWNVQNR
jgi:hypothetical protein